jgi:asparagine synthase (glutamine-hydrolysing)
MGGVFGVIDSKQKTDPKKILDRMATCLSHREWYQVDTIADKNEGIGMGRLGIGIFNPETQPIYNEDRNLFIVMDGELYGYHKLKRVLEANGHQFSIGNDPEFALHLYEEIGEKFVNYLNGSFILAIFDINRKMITIANDRFGLCPLYYTHNHGRFLFAPEMKGVLQDEHFNKSLDMKALAEYIRFQYILGDKTFFEGLKLLPNASVLQYNMTNDTLTIQPYWDISKIPKLPPNLSFEEAVEEAGRLLELSVNELMKGNYRFGVYLSSGIDSRAILGLIDRSKFPITTITFGQQGCRDMIYAQKIASELSTEHHCFKFQNGKWLENFADFHMELTEGFHSWVHAHGISILGHVRQLIDVNLTGLGGGQPPIDWEDKTLLCSKDDISFSCRLFDVLSQKATWPSISEIEEKYLFSSKISSQMHNLAFESFRFELSKFDFLPYAQRAGYFAICNTDRRLFQYYTVFNKSHFEQRFPFYNYPYFEFVNALPPEMLFQRRLRRAIILNKMPRLARVPYDKDNLPITNNNMSYLSFKLLQKCKSAVNRYLRPMFPEHASLNADYEYWLRSELREWGEGIMLGKQIQERDIFNPEFLRSLWQRHLSGLEVNYIGKLAPIMTYEMMLRRFYD